jgi:hypothetical protein
MSNFYYIVNLENNGVLTVAGGELKSGTSVQVLPIIEPRVNYQLWHMDDPEGSYIKVVGSELVLQALTVDFFPDFWVELATPTVTQSQLWIYNHNASLLTNMQSNCMLELYAIAGVFCNPPSFEDAPQTDDVLQGTATQAASRNLWQLQVAGTT